jgi:hypothetical protein
MEIELTALADLDAFPLSHSRMEGGENAGRNTWQASLEAADETSLLDTPDKLDAMRDFARASGGWGDEETAAWTPQEVNALFLQWIAGDVRQCPAALEGITYEERDGQWFHSSADEPDMGTGPFDSITEAHEDASPGRGFSTANSLEEIDWQVTEAAQREGNTSSNLFRADDGRIFFELGN